MSRLDSPMNHLPFVVPRQESIVLFVIILIVVTSAGVAGIHVARRSVDRTVAFARPCCCGSTETGGAETRTWESEVRYSITDHLVRAECRQRDRRHAASSRRPEALRPSDTARARRTARGSSIRMSRISMGAKYAVSWWPRAVDQVHQRPVARRLIHQRHLDERMGVRPNLAALRQQMVDEIRQQIRVRLRAVTVVQPADVPRHVRRRGPDRDRRPPGRASTSPACPTRPFQAARTSPWE